MTWEDTLFNVPLWFVLLLLAVILFYVHGTKTFKTWSRQGIKGPRPLPYFGNMLEALSKGGYHQIDRKLAHDYGKLIGSYFGRKPQLLCADPEFLRKALIKEFSSTTNRLEMTRRSIFNVSLLAVTDDHWRHTRSALSPTFTSGKLKQMMPLIEECCLRFVEHIKSLDEQPFDIKVYAGGYTMDVIASTAFGIQVDSQKSPDEPILEYARALVGVSRKLSLWERIKLSITLTSMFFLPTRLAQCLARLGFDLNDMDAVNYFAQLCKRILSGRDEPTDRIDFVQLCKEQWVKEVKPDDPDTRVNEKGYVWTAKGLTTDEIVSNAMLFFAAGFETSSTTLHFVLYELAWSPDVQQKAFDEIMAKAPSSTTYEDLAKLTYLDWVIDETLRMYPPAARVDRLVSKQMDIDGVVLPEGSLVTAMIYAIHFDPEIWPNPDTFDPERFSPENSEGRHQCAYAPFSIGNRNCIGMRLALLEIKMALVHVLRNFRFETCEHTLKKPLVFLNFAMQTVRPLEIKAMIR